MSDNRGNNQQAAGGYRKPASYNKPNFQNRRQGQNQNGYNNQQGGYQNRGGNRFNNRKPGGFNKRPRPQLSPEKLEQLRAAKARKLQLEATRKALIEAFPNTFSWKTIKPLKVDIHLDIFDYFDSANQPSDSPVKKVAIRQFLAQYIRSKEYHLAALKSGKRYDLQGNVVATFSDEELAYHQQNLKASQGNRPQRKPQGFKPRQNNARPFMKRPQQGGSYPRFKVGDIVLLNGREGSITKIEDGKYRVQFLDSKLSITVDAKQSYTMKKKFMNRGNYNNNFHRNNNFNNHNCQTLAQST